MDGSSLKKKRCGSKKIDYQAKIDTIADIPLEPLMQQCVALTRAILIRVIMKPLTVKILGLQSRTFRPSIPRRV